MYIVRLRTSDNAIIDFRPLGFCVVTQTSRSGYLVSIVTLIAHCHSFSLLHKQSALAPFLRIKPNVVETFLGYIHDGRGGGGGEDGGVAVL